MIIRRPLARVPVFAAAVSLLVLRNRVAQRYGYHRDELYFRMLPAAWGYTDQPLLTPLLARATLLLAMGLGTLASVGGLTVSGLVSADVNVAPGAAIVLLALAGFVVAWPIGMLLRRRQRLAEPFAADPGVGLADDTDHTVVPENHQHEHGDDCGHPAVPHGDHVDYIHDGHRHAPHGSHYDEH